MPGGPHRVLHDILMAPFKENDPGDAGTLRPTRDRGVFPIVTAAAETRTLAQPTKAGIVTTVVLRTDGGVLTLTVTGGYNQDSATSILFINVEDSVTFRSIQSGTTYVWEVADFHGLKGLVKGERLMLYMPTPETATATATLTDAQMLTGILVATPTAAAAYTMRTGTQLDAALVALGYVLRVNDAFDLTIINSGGTGDDITLTASTGITIVGDPVVGPVADVATEQAGQGTFRLRRTAANTWVAYRIS